jgi:hypothetical protein
MVVQHELTPLSAGIRKTKAVDNIIEPALQQDKQIGAGDTSLCLGSFKKQVKLLFRKPVHPFDFLLFTQLNTVIGNFPAPPFSMLAGRI